MRDTLEKEHIEEESTISTVVGTLFFHHDSLQYPAQFTLRMTGLGANSKHMPQSQKHHRSRWLQVYGDHAGAIGRTGGANRTVGDHLER